MKKINNKKGFTLAELLIVVAIIAVLVAISIPIFTAQLEKAREATDLANIRGAYAEAMSEAVGGTKTEGTVGNVTIATSGTDTTYTVTTDKARSTGAFDKVDTDITWATLPSSVTTGKKFIVTITVDGSGEATAEISQES